jgi:hypothetical protein
MSHLIEFVHDWFAEVEGALGRVKQVPFRKGERVRAEIHPVDSVKGLPESAHLRLENGGTARHVPLARIAIIKEQARAA